MSRPLVLSMFLIGAAWFGVACDALPAIPLLSGTTQSSSGGLTYEAPVTLTVRNGTVMPGTSIAYGGKTSAGAAKVMFSGLAASKQTGDSVDWQGEPAPNVKVALTTRVVSFDESNLTLFGTAHIEVTHLAVKTGESPSMAPMEFSAPVSYSLAKNATIPGTLITFVGSTSEGARFSGVEGYPYRKTLDSLQYSGQLTPQVFVKLDLRVLNFSETGAVVGGAANVKILAR